MNDVRGYKVTEQILNSYRAISAERQTDTQTYIQFYICRM